MCVAARSAHIMPGPAVARVFPNPGGILRPAMCIFFGIQGLVEHYADVLPTLAKAGPFLVPVALSIVLLFFYYAHKGSTHPKMVLFSVLMYVFELAAAKTWGGFPKDTSEEQIAALKDPYYNMCHLILHVSLTASLLAVSYTVPSAMHSKSA